MRILNACLLMWFLACPVCPAAEGLRATRPDSFKPITTEAGRPTFVIPPDSPLARNEHPRMLLCKEDLAIVRGRLSDPRLAQEFEALKRQAGKAWTSESGCFTHALLWNITGERKYLDAIRSSPEFRKPTWVFGWAATMDLIWDDLTVEERAELSGLVAKAVAKDGSLYWRPTLHLVSVFYEGGKGPNDALFLQRMRHDFDQTLLQWTGKLNGWSAGRGGSDMSHGYNGEHAYWEPFIAAIAWSHGTGEDYISRAAFSKYQSAFYWYHFVPGLEPLTVEKIGVTRTADDASAVSPGHSGANHLLFLTFTRENDGLGLAWMDKYRTQEPAWNRDREALGRVLWWNPQQQPLDPATLPLTRLFPTSGHVIMRSDWSEDATFATFRCGRFGEIDGGWGRNNADNLSFTIRKRGPLAIDSGPVHGQNTTVLKFLGEGSDSSVPAIGNYGRQTIAHNSITIGDGEYTHRDWQGKPVSVVRTGGQSVPQARDWWTRWGFSDAQRDFMQGRITAYRTHPMYDYACGDARFSYPPEWGVQEITRQFVYLKPDIFVIYDRLGLADQARTPCWMLHTLRQPKASGDEKSLSPAEIGPQFLWNGTERIPHPSPGGHIGMGGDGFTVESGSPGKPGRGWLAVRTLAPAEVDCQRKKIGGKGHDFEVAGVQYALADEGYKMADDPYAVGSTIGLLGWRVELRPNAASKNVEFLHVMQVGVEGQPADALRGATHQATAQAHVISIRHGNNAFTLTLSRTGRRGGSIAVKGPPADLNQPLPETVEDHWRYFSDDPNFKTWMTDPRYRAVIEPNTGAAQ
ncbi:MAG: heparinase II/III family protein [Tepidisphaerales bacterium]